MTDFCLQLVLWVQQSRVSLSYCCVRRVLTGGRFDRRFRVYDISDYGETIKTYKRSEHDEVLDELIIAGSGAAPYNSVV
jgi:hypothetical protein